MKSAPSLHTHARVSGAHDVEILKVLTLDEARQGRFPKDRILLWEANAAEEYAGAFSREAGDLVGRVSVCAPRDPGAVQPGDVIRLRAGGSLVSVLYRRGSASNTLFVTERCNSICVMCSQPPRADDDSWRVVELAETISLVDRDEAVLGFTGGEPTLLRERLASLIQQCACELPDTLLHVLTNGRSFCDPALATQLVEAGAHRTVWAVPLYSDVAEIHDEVVGAPGAFNETIAGLYELARRRARVEIRVVLHAMTIPRLRELCAYIYRRLPFAEHVALMGLEPMGLAKTNRSRLWMDPIDYMPVLSDASHYLDIRGMQVSIYNLPLCILPKSLWQLARASISDWKNVSDAECGTCAVQQRCAGFFASAGPQWKSRGIKSIASEMTHELA